LNLRDLARGVVPFALRAELVRLKRLPAWILERPGIARTRLLPGEWERFRYRLAHHTSPLERVPGAVERRLQEGKERNVTLAAACLDGRVVRPYELFSYHHAVGRPSRLRGFRMGLELHGAVPSRGVGGGCCQVSNALYLLALRAGMRIVERHRHGLDLFPDHLRSVPFGCGATVFYNQADLRFENPLAMPVLLRFRIEARELVGELWTVEGPGWTVEVYEVDHRFFREEEGWMRENRIRRRFRLAGGDILLDQEVAHNRGRVMYEPEEVETCGVRC
jgi:vancomycin resistance protein VanW